MDGSYGLQPPTDYLDRALMTPENLILPADYQSYILSSGASATAPAFQTTPYRDHRIPYYGSEQFLSAASAINSEGGETSVVTPEIPRQDAAYSSIKAKIASHPCYPRLLEAYIDCQKVGAPPEIACLLDEIRRENDLCKADLVPTCVGADPELDEFMDTYYEMLVKYKSDLARPFDEATTFLNKIETQLANLCTGPSSSALSDDGAASSDEEFSAGEVDVQDNQMRGEERDIKDRLLRRFGSRLGTLRLEFSKKKKKGKLPKEARQVLLEWWNVHYRWPYPTEVDKIALAKSTGLDQKQINNWFINQRKRHWKPSENMQFSVMDNLAGRIYATEE